MGTPFFKCLRTMKNKPPSWLKMGVNLWIHGAKFTVIDCSNPKNTVVESESGQRSSHNVVALFSSGYVKFSEAINDDSLRIAELPVTKEELDRANRIAKDFDNLPNERGKLGLAMVDLANKYEVDRSTIALWKKKYREEGVPGLIRRFDKRGGRGKKRLDSGVEKMIKQGIQEHYLTRTPKSMDETIRLIRSLAAAEGIEVPAVGTIRRRIKELSENEVLKAQKGSAAASDSLHVSQAEHRVQRPLQEVQIDHSPGDIQLLSEELRQILGKAQITLIQDVYTRVILGMYIGYEHPSFLSVSYALREAVFPKEDVLSRYGLEEKLWPVYGLMETLHSDNATEFDGKQMDHFCLVNRVEKRFRPIGRKEYGGHIESGLKAILKHLQTLPGTTFSNPQQRGDYNAEKNAQIDLQELRQIIYLWVVKVFNNKPRDELGGLSPLQMWQKSIDEGWSPRMPASYDEFRYSLLPFEERMIGRRGISLKGFKYSGPCLRHWRAMEKTNEGKKYKVYYDPLDMRWADFVHPDGSGITKLSIIGFSSEQPITLRELNAAKGKSVRYPTPTPDLHLAHQQEKEILENAAKKNKKARKELELRSDAKSRQRRGNKNKGEEFNSDIDYSYLPEWAKKDDHD